MKYLIYAVALFSVTANSVLAESSSTTISVEYKGRNTLVTTTRAKVTETDSIYSEGLSFEQSISPVELGGILKSFEIDNVTSPKDSEEDRIQNSWWRGSDNRNIAWLTDGVQPKADAPAVAVRSGIARVLIRGIELQKLKATTSPVLWEINLISTNGISGKPQKVDFIVNDCDTPIADTNCAITVDEIWKSASKKLHEFEGLICSNSKIHIYALKQKKGDTNFLIIAERTPELFHQITMYFSRGALLTDKNFLDAELKTCVAGNEEKPKVSF